MLAVTKLNF